MWYNHVSAEGHIGTCVLNVIVTQEAYQERILSRWTLQQFGNQHKRRPVYVLDRQIKNNVSQTVKHSGRYEFCIISEVLGYEITLLKQIPLKHWEEF